MAQKDSGNKRRPAGIFYDMGNYFKLVTRLIGDDRVNPLIKLLPIGAGVYFLIPDPIIGPFEDTAFLGFAVYLFVELCPAEIVEEHRRALDPEYDRRAQTKKADDIVDAQFIEQGQEIEDDEEVTTMDDNIL